MRKRRPLVKKLISGEIYVEIVDMFLADKSLKQIQTAFPDYTPNQILKVIVGNFRTPTKIKENHLTEVNIEFARFLFSKGLNRATIAKEMDLSCYWVDKLLKA